MEKKRTLIRFLLILYAGTMLWLLFGRPSGRIEGLSYREMLLANCNLIPFFTIGNYLRVLAAGKNPFLMRHCFINLAGNVLLFIPAGILLPWVFPRLRNFLRFGVVCLGVMFLIETAQLFTLLGSFDVDDLILNLLGMGLGFLLFSLARVPGNKRRQI